MSYLSKMGVFPLERLIHVNPDYFKQLMPEWEGYKKHDASQAGAMCHRESGFLQELAQEVAMQANQNVWVDGSLQDGKWYSHLFAETRRRYPRYRIALLHVFAELETVKARAQKRGQETGRFVPVDTLESCWHAVVDSVRVLGPLADFFAKINNDKSTPLLELVEDRSQSLARVQDAFRLGQQKNSSSHFPRILHPIGVRVDKAFAQAVRLNDETRSEYAKGKIPMDSSHIMSYVGPDGTVVAHVHTGPLHTLSFDRASRKRADIPDNAICYTFCYGKHSDCSPRHGRGRETPNCTGFLYFDKDGACASASIFWKYNLEKLGQDIVFLEFQAPQPIPTDLEASLDDSWCNVVWPDDARQCADRMTWILPSQLPGLRRGALGYRLRRHKNCIYFPLAADCCF